MLAGTAVFAGVLDEQDVPHDNLEGVLILGAGALAGVLVLGVVLARSPSAVDRARATDLAWTAVRLVLAYEMIRYGTAKLVGQQFYPQYWRLDERVGDLHPMSLAWVFFGRTYGYQAIGGLIEVTGGVLVCFRRTTLVGALLMATALVNVVLVDVFYEVWVRLLASTYLILDLALIGRDWRRLAQLFASVERPGGHVAGRWLGRLAVAAAIVVPAAKMVREALQHRVFEREPLEGAWRVDATTGAADPSWERFYFEKGDRGSVRAGSRRISFQTRLEGRQNVQLSIGERPSVLRGTFAIQGKVLRFDGRCDDAACGLTLTREYPR